MKQNYDHGMMTLVLYLEILCLVKLTQNVDRNKYSYCGYAIGFFVFVSFSFCDGNELVKNVKILCILCKYQTQGLDYTKLIAESENSINFNDQKNKCFLS